MPKINAIVPPDTPGTISAEPIAKPVNTRRKYSSGVFGFAKF